jgi:hypothetical protein
MQNNLENEWRELIREFEEKIGNGLGVNGIQNTWSAAMEGKGLKLLVEKDFRVPGFLTDNMYHLYTKPPKKKHKIIPDAVDGLIETVLNKNGRVFFVDNGALAAYQKVALITRYR